MYYGDSSQTSSTENSPFVWENNYLSVWHLTEEGDGTIDEYDGSTVNDFDGRGGSGTASKTPSRVWGKIDSGQSFDGINDYINFSSMNPQDYNDITMEAWYKSANTSVTDDGYIFYHSESYGGGPGFVLSVTEDAGNANRLRMNTYNNTGNYDPYYGTSNISDQQWHYVVGVRDNGRIRIYVDDNEENNTADDHPNEIIKVDTVKSPKVGDFPDKTEQVNGTLDEIRISRIGRSWDWINATYNNVNDTASFISVGSEETPSSPSASDTTSYYEWVELYNPGSSAVDLDGWTLNDNDGNTFNLSGAGSIPSGGYLVCHFGQSGTNSTTNLYGAITTTSGTTLTMLENSDDLMLVDSYDIIIDYVVWGADAGSDDDKPSAWGQWTAGEYVDTSSLAENETIGRDKDSTDTDLPADWEDSGTGKADAYGVNATSATQGSQNLTVVIPEFSGGFIPLFGFLIMAVVIRKKYRKNCSKKHSQKPKKS
jgi:hypothetical protein